MSLTNNEITQNSKSEPKKFSILCTFNHRTYLPCICLFIERIQQDDKKLQFFMGTLCLCFALEICWLDRSIAHLWRFVVVVLFHSSHLNLWSRKQYMNVYILGLPVHKITIFTNLVVSPEERRITAEDDIADDSCNKY